MNSFAFAICILLAGLPALAQRNKFSVNAETPEGRLLQLAGQIEDPAKKMELLEEYVEKYPKSEGLGYALGLLIPLYKAAGQPDKVIAAAEKALAVEPSNPVPAHAALQACEQKRDPACIKDWSGRTAAAAAKVAESKKPEDEEEAEEWKREVDFARQVTTYTEYALYAAALTTADPAVVISLVHPLLERNAASQYVPQIGGRYVMSLLQSNQQQKAVQFAEKAVANNTASEEVRLVAGDAALNARNYTQAVAAVQPMIDTLPAKAAPEGVSAADWEAKKKSVLGRAYWIAGMAHGNAEKWEDADKAMRGALEVLGGDKDLLPSIYFYIGLANYRLAEGPKGQKARMADARKFMQLCAQLRSPYQGTAQKNLAAMAAGR